MMPGSLPPPGPFLGKGEKLAASGMCVREGRRGGQTSEAVTLDANVGGGAAAGGVLSAV